MNISTHNRGVQSRSRLSSAPKASQSAADGPQESFTLASRKQKNAIKTGIALTLGAAAGGYGANMAVSGLVGTVANVAGGVGGAIVGGAAGAFVGGFIGANASDGPGSLNGMLGGLFIGGAIGAAGGAFGGAVASEGTQAILGTTAGVFLGAGGAMALFTKD